MGPGSSIILKDVLTDAQLDLINKTVDNISDSRKDEDFWVSSTKPIGGNIETDGSPFIITHDDITFENPNYDEDELKQIYKSIGYRPGYSVDLGAGAIFSLNYLPWYRSSSWYLNADWSSIEPFFKKFIKNMPGNIYTVKYKTISERKWAYHICDVEFLEFWLNCPEFHMIK